MRIVILAVLTILLEIYFYKKLLGSLNYILPDRNRAYRKITGISITYLNLYLILLIIYWLYNLIAGEGRFRFVLENSWWDYLILYPFWISIFIVLQSCFILLPLELIKLVLRPFFGAEKEKLRKIFAVLSVLVISFFILYVPVRIIIDYNFVELRHVEYSKPDLPYALNGFKIALIADVQADWYTDSDRLSNYIETVNGADPDIVLIAGDLITSTPDYIKLSAEALSKLKSKMGVFSCVGDHDNWAYRSDNKRSRKEIKDALARYQISFIDDENRILNFNGAKVGISFITESYSKRISSVRLDSLVKNIDNCDLKIILVHQPTDKVINTATENDVNLVLAGHTHGGQVTFLFPFFNLTPTSFETEHIKGSFFYNDLLLIVNRGLGMSLVPVRYNSTPEVTLITLKK